MNCKMPAFLLSFVIIFFVVEVKLMFAEKQATPFYIVTAADERFFSCLCNFVGGIHKVNFEDVGEIAVFDLGFNEKQLKILGTIAKVRVYSVENTNPDILTLFVTRPDGKAARGWYAWKPVVIKQALEMFPDILYIDAGILILKSLNNLIKHIRKHGYFLMDCSHSIAWMTTKNVIQYFNLNSQEREWILSPSTYGVSAGFQGLTHELYENYVLPMYELSKDLRFFADDGTAPNGFGTGRQDQTLFSIYARLLHLDIFKLYQANYIDVQGQVSTFTYGIDFITGGIEKFASMPDLTSYIKYKN